MENVQFLTFNHGLISRYALARVDLEHLRYAAEKMSNWMPRVFGSMMLRPGMGYVTTTHSNLLVKTIPFVRSTPETAIVEVRDNFIRVLVNEQAVVRPSVSSAITNPSFDTDLSGWTDADEAGGLSAWNAGGFMALTGNGFNAGIRYQTVTVSGGNINTEHALRIQINIAPVVLRVGSTVGGDEYVKETTLGKGDHSIAFTPTGNFTVQFSNRQPYKVEVKQCEIEAAGEMAIPAPWSSDEFPNLRWDQSADVLYVCDGANQQRKIERRSDRSWSVVRYEPQDGPFRAINISRITLQPDNLSSIGILNASAPLFKGGHVGALFRLISAGQHVSGAPAGENQFTDPIEVTGVGDSRKFTIDVWGTWSGDLYLQRSLGAVGAWVNVQTFSGGTHVFNDKLDNQIAYYRLGFPGAYSSGVANVDLVFGGGSTIGTCRVLAVDSPTRAEVVIYQAFGSLDATPLWYEGAWSDERGWPSSVSLFQGRLWWLGGDKFFGSESDAYESFDDQTVGDAGPIQRSIGQGPIDTINWAVPLQRLVAGTTGTEITARSSSIDEPLTPTNFNLTYPTNLGSARIAAARIDSSAVFVQRSAQRIYRLALDTSSTSYVSFDYAAADLTALVPELGLPGIAQIVLQRQPDTRLHVRRTDGTVFVLVFDALENVKCWINLTLSGVCEDICVLPGEPEDAVYYIMNRTINGTTVRYYEKWALESECVGDTLNKQADSFKVYSGSATNVLTGFQHLRGQQVVVWGDGKDLSPGFGAAQKLYTVTNAGNVTLDAGVNISSAVVGLPYDAEFKGVKLAYAAQMGSALTQRKRVSDIALILADTHYQGLEYGPALNDLHLDPLPLVENGDVTDPDTVWPNYDNDSFSFDGAWDTDSRVCLRAMAPRPCRVMAIVVGLDTKG